MYWKDWIIEMCPGSWTDEDALEHISFLCPEVTLEMIREVRYPLCG